MKANEREGWILHLNVITISERKKSCERVHLKGQIRAAVFMYRHV